MNPKWTPGPWRACAWDPMERPHVHKDDPNQRACCPPDLPLNGADAHLMATAPALYGVLEEARHCLYREFLTAGGGEEARRNVTLRKMGRLVARIDRTLATARGESTPPAKGES